MPVATRRGVRQALKEESARERSCLFLSFFSASFDEQYNRFLRPFANLLCREGCVYTLERAKGFLPTTAGCDDCCDVLAGF